MISAGNISPEIKREAIYILKIASLEKQTITNREEFRELKKKSAETTEEETTEEDITRALAMLSELKARHEEIKAKLESIISEDLWNAIRAEIDQNEELKFIKPFTSI